MRDLLIEISGSIRRNKLRTSLTGFAVAWGIFMLIILLGAGNGLRNMTKQSMGDININTMTVNALFTTKPYGGFEALRKLNLEDKDIVRTESDLFDNVIDEVSGIISQGGVTITYDKRYSTTSFTGCNPDVKDMMKIKMLSGRFITELDNTEYRKVVVIPSSMAESLFFISDDFDRVIGKRVKAGNSTYRVVGVYKSDSMQMGAETFVPFNTMKLLYKRGKNVDSIIFSFHGLTTINENEDFVKQYKSIMNAAHMADPTDNAGIHVSNHYLQNMQMEKGMGLINKALWIVGLFTLLSGIVGVSNIMLISVKERTHEFGIRKALGARPWDILKIIITESVIITSVFGYVGMVLGMLGCLYMKFMLGSHQTEVLGYQISMLKDPTVGLDVALEATLLLVIAGTVAGLIPALKAARVLPIEALRAN